MSNLEKYDEAFRDSLKLNGDIALDELEYRKIKLWDSIGHMTLISSLENAFDIEIETNDVINFSSYKKGKQILKKYGVEI